MKFSTLVLFACLLTACVSGRSSTADTCTYRERDLTVAYEQRTSWCSPGDRR